MTKRKKKPMTVAEAGAKGGRAGTGKDKERGDSAYYSELAKASWLKRKRAKEKA